MVKASFTQSSVEAEGSSQVHCVLGLVSTVTEYRLHWTASAPFRLKTLAEVIMHEFLFLNAFEDRVVVHQRLEWFLLLSPRQILGRRAVGVFRPIAFLLSVDDIGRNVSECPVSRPRLVSFRVLTELECTGVAKLLYAHLAWERFGLQHIELAVVGGNGLDRSR